MLKTRDILKKTERIASAAYLLTGFFDDKEPLKWDIRNLSSRIVSKAAHMKDIAHDAEELLSLFSIAKAAGLVSDANHSILASEISKYIQTVENIPAHIIGSEFFAISAPTELPRAESLVVKDKVSEQTPPRLAADRAEEPVREQKEKVLREFGAVAVKKNARQSIIINLLKKKKEIMIKDVSPLIEGVSEKTIQRELLSMVDQGIIRKEGEKRWSRYSLA